MQLVKPAIKFMLHLLRVTVLSLLIAQPASAASIQETFSRYTKGSQARVDHAAWDKLLKVYVVAGQDGLNRVDYKAFKAKDAKTLKAYLSTLQAADPAKLDKPEQFAYWVNLYNAVTIDVILDHYPVKSIRDIRPSNILFPGPWDEKLVTVSGLKLSLNDIEHGILRKIWSDPRVHYAVNCASVGCPNLQRAAFTGGTLEAMLDKGAREYINSPRGANVIGASLVASKIYRWFEEDFGNSQQATLTHLRQYANPELKAELDKVTRVARYEYDWSLNETR